MVLATDKINTINLPKPPESNEQTSFIRPKQSANVLFKFMNKLDYLKDIIKHKAIIPRYYEEKIDYLNIEGLDKIAFPMSCFCDIHLNKLEEHMSKYGFYGIGLSKEWGIKHGIQPIQYINQYSNLKKDFSEIFSNIFKIPFEERMKYAHYHDYLIHNLFFMKAIEGEMFSDKTYVKRNFHDEKEWRFIPDFRNVETELPLVIDQEQMNPKGYNSFSQGIRQKPELWLKFDFEAVKYIIVSDRSSRKSLVNHIIDNQIGESVHERYELISKIIVFNELREDW